MQSVSDRIGGKFCGIIWFLLNCGIDIVISKCSNSMQSAIHGATSDENALIARNRHRLM